MITVLFNPTSGAKPGAVTAQHISEAFAAGGTDVHIVTLARGQDHEALAREAAARSDVVVAAGGDGTVSNVARAVAGTEAVLGILPTGTLNHFARDLGLPLELADAVATVVEGLVLTVDVADVNERLFLNNSSIGVYPNVINMREALRKEGHRKWTALAIAMWRALRRYRGISVRLTVNGRHITARTPFVFVGNNEYDVEGLDLGGRPSLTAGQLCVYVAPRITTRDLPMLLLRALAGRAARSGTFEVIRTTELVIETMRPGPISVSLDGETEVMSAPLRYKTRAGGLRVIAPPLRDQKT